MEVQDGGAFDYGEATHQYSEALEDVWDSGCNVVAERTDDDGGG